VDETVCAAPRCRKTSSHREGTNDELRQLINRFLETPD
jgi:hypothetical protein